MSILLVGLALLALVAVAFGLGRTYEAAMRDQAEPERPADWAVQMAKSDPQRLINALRKGELP